MTLLWDGTPAGPGLSPWSPQCKPGRITVVPPPPGAPSGDSRKWLRFEVRSGDIIGTDQNKERAQLICAQTPAAKGAEGQAFYRAQSVIFEPAYAPPASDPLPLWNIWKQDFSEQGQAPLNFQVNAQNMHLVLTQSTGTDANRPTQYLYDAGALARGVCIDILEYILWSDDPTKGRYALWVKVGSAAPFRVDCKPVKAGVPQPQRDNRGHYIVQTLYAPKDIAVSPMQGWYRHLHTETDVMWQTGQKHVTTYAEAIAALSPGWPAVEPGSSAPPPPPPPAPSPSGLGVRITGQTATTVSLAWNPVPKALGYIYEIDGSPHLVDGKRHFTFDATLAHTTLSKPADGKQHTYAVTAIGTLEEGSVTA